MKRGIEAGEFADCYVDAVSTTLLALCDGFGIRLMLGDPRVTVDSAQGVIWATAAGALKVAPEFPQL